MISDDPHRNINLLILSIVPCRELLHAGDKGTKEVCIKVARDSLEDG